MPRLQRHKALSRGSIHEPGRVPEELRSRLRDLTRQAEQQSMTTCQRCGQPGELRTFGGWVATLCARHAKQVSIEV